MTAPHPRGRHRRGPRSDGRLAGIAFLAADVLGVALIAAQAPQAHAAIPPIEQPDHTPDDADQATPDADHDVHPSAP